MKPVIYFFILLLSACGCTKESSLHMSTENKASSPRFPPQLHNIPPVVRTLNYCILSFEMLAGRIGTAPLALRSVVLENGETIQLGDYGVLSLTYTAVPRQEAHSLFRSELRVQYNRLGYTESHLSDVWSLGCAFQQSGTPPFTNLVSGGMVLLINTCFIWPLPPYAGQRIRWLKTD